MPINIIGLKLPRHYALPHGGVRTAMLRNLILALIVYPLLMPPGMCLCGAARGEGGESRFCNGPCAEPYPASHCERAKTNCRSCNGRHGVPSSERCPPSCPGNDKADHSKLVEHGPTVPVASATIAPVSFCVDLFSGQRLHTATSLWQPSARPIYITLCTLVI